MTCSAGLSSKNERFSRRGKKKDKSAEPSEKSQAGTDLDIYGDLDASKSLLLHGLQSDFIEEEMSDDKEFRFSLHSSATNCQFLSEVAFYLIFLEKRFWSKKSALFWFRLILPEKSNTRWVW